MRILTYRNGGSDRAGVQSDGSILDAAELLGADSITVRELLGGDRVGELREAVAGGGSDPVPEDGARAAPTGSGS